MNSWATAGNATATAAGVSRADGMLTGVSNLVKYRGAFGPVSVGASYRFGEQTGFSDGNAAVLAAAYNAGPLGLVVTAEQANGITVAASGRRDRTRTVHLGASYQVGPTKLFAVVRNFDRSLASGAADLESRTAWVGAAYAASPALTLTAAYYHQDIRSGVRPGDDPKLLTLRARYALSKRTDLYAVVGHAKARSGAVGVSRDDAGFLGSQSNVAAGIQHRF
ncbi:porin [Aquabacterium sp. J223]|uniref:porin n=1 Tax=Aquabacterium sp. J223 TaxID=2898431 RepID=UPI00289D81DB|nr:porin [Aquabacterium sp. J223]